MKIIVKSLLETQTGYINLLSADFVIVDFVKKNCVFLEQNFSSQKPLDFIYTNIFTEALCIYAFLCSLLVCLV